MSSRIIVKNLPVYLTEEKLKEHLSKNGYGGTKITDVRLKKNREGVSRRFAFVGFRSEDDAKNAVKFFNKSFIDTSRIEVEVAKSFASTAVPVPWSERKKRLREAEKATAEQLERLEAEMNTRNAKKAKKSEKSAKPTEQKDGKYEKLQEYLNVMQPRSHMKTWANDEGIDVMSGVATSGEKQANPVVPEGESDDEYESFVPGKGVKQSEEVEDDEEEFIPLSEIPNSEKSEKSESGETEGSEEPQDTKSESENSGKPAEELSDFEWLKMRRKLIKDGAEAEDAPPAQPEREKSEREKRIEADEAAVEAKKRREAQPEPEIPGETDQDRSLRHISETGRLFVRNIDYHASEKDFNELFSQYGELTEVHMPVDPKKNKPKGFVYVQFADPDDACQAFLSLDKQIFQGRLLHILPGDKKRGETKILSDFELKNLPLKKQQELKRKYQAAKQQFNWNSLYMNQDAVLESVAAKMGVRKADLLDTQSSSAAVQQALAEASVINEVRSYFEDRGVDLTHFGSKERSDSVILVKNFPFGTTLEEIGELFAPFGSIKRLLMPPAGTIAIVEFANAPEARAAFAKLAYRRFKSSILYLEKGPVGLFTKEAAETDGYVAKSGEKEPVKKPEVKAEDLLETTDEPVEETEEIGPTTSLFVKNLNFKTTAKDLTELFKTLDGFAVATVKTKPNPKKDGEPLSMGFGFVEFRSKEQAIVAMKAMDGYVLDGHQLQLKLSHRGGDSGASALGPTKKAQTKLVVKNLPFEATRKDIVQLFGTFGSLKSARVPKKFDKTARGFAFVEFVTAKDAENAMKSLTGTHLLGRKLVMQYVENDAANAEEEIERMTRKARDQTRKREVAAMRLTGKRRVEMDGEDSGLNSEF